MIKIGYDLDRWTQEGNRQPISVNLEKNPHWLICGNSGSGKSYLLLMLLRNLLVEYGTNIKLWFCDFKSSDDFAFMREYSHYYTGDDCSEGVDNFYAEYQRVKNGEVQDGIIRLLLFDEWAGFQVWETQKDKKVAEKYKRYLLEILLMGRSMQCGVWIIMQRNDAKYIDGREQFFVTIVLGKMSREMKQMILQGDEIEQKPFYSCGEGIVRKDELGTRFLKVPRLRNVTNVQRQIRDCLQQVDTAEGGGDEGAGRG